MSTGFREVNDLVDAEVTYGNYRITSWRKNPTQVTAQGMWFDLSMSPGNPVPQFYAAAPGIAMGLAQSTDGGIFHGGAVSPQKMVLRKMMGLSVSAILPMPMILCDYLMYYPFIDESNTDPQPLTTNVALPRYPDGKGVQMMAIVVAGQVGGQTFQVTYTNSDGVHGRVSGTVKCNTQTAVGTILTTDKATVGCAGPFIPLQSGDSGVQYIESVQMNGADIGLFSLVLVMPLDELNLRGIDAPVEVDYFKDFGDIPIIKDDAYLNFICCPNASLTGTFIHGLAEFVWSRDD